MFYLLVFVLSWINYSAQYYEKLPLHTLPYPLLNFMFPISKPCPGKKNDFER